MPSSLMETVTRTVSVVAGSASWPRDMVVDVVIATRQGGAKSNMGLHADAAV